MSEEQASTDVSLSINDLKTCIQIIDLCSSRGAFKPEEFQAIGVIHARLSAFVAKAVPANTDSAVSQPTQEKAND